jgi:hypothetical protein
MLGIALRAADQQWSTRPPPVPKPPRDRSEAAPANDWPPEGWIEYGGTLIFPVGYTSGGCPYGVVASQLDDDDGTAMFGARWESLRQRWAPTRENSRGSHDDAAFWERPP